MPDVHGHCAPGFEPLRAALSNILASGAEVPDARVAFGYAMNQGRGGWQHKHVRDLIDLIYARL